MKITKKVTSIVLALMLVISAFAGLSITAGAVDVPTSATLTIHKYDLDEKTDNQKYIGNAADRTGTATDATSIPAGAKALEDVEFTIYYQGPLGAAIPNSPKTTETPTDTQTTDSSGEAEFNIDGTDLPVGLYYVVETNAPAKVTTKTSPFYVYLPMTTQNTDSADDGVTWNNDVHVYPKNLTTLGGATLTKTINNASITADTTLVVAPKFKLVEYNGGTEGTPIATDIEAKAGYNTVAKASGLNAKYDTVVIAQKNGVIAVDGLPVGTYAFIETDAAQIVSGTDLPMDTTPREFTVTKGNNVDVTTADGNTFGQVAKMTATDEATYTFTIDNSTEPTVSKAVDKQTASIGEDVTWTITPIIPADIATYQKYTVTDAIDSRLDISGTDAVTVTATGATLAKDTDYTVAVDVRNVTVNFTAAGRAALADASALQIKIVTQINDTADADAAISNKAILDYQNSFMTESKQTPSNEPTTKTGAFRILKVDAADETPLAGVEFTLTDSTGAPIKVTGTAGNYVVDPDGTSNTVVTDSNGLIIVKGLKYTTTDPADTRYILTETKTKNGYQLAKDPFKITVANGTGLVDNQLRIPNAKQPQLPITGGMGTILFTVAGLVLIGGAAFFFIRSRKSSKEEA